MVIVYPKPLPNITEFYEPHEHGFTLMEKVAIRNAWRTIKQNQSVYAKEFFLDFYSQHEEALEYYRNISDGKISMEDLIRHPHAMFQTYEVLIKKGLDNQTFVTLTLTSISKHHGNRKVPRHKIMLLLRCFKEFILKLLHKRASPTLANAFEKLNQIILHYHNGEQMKPVEHSVHVVKPEEQNI